MPVPMNPDSVYEYVRRGRHDGQGVLNITHWILQEGTFTPGSAPFMEDALDVLQLRFDEGFVPSLHEGYTVDTDELREITGRVEITPTPPPEETQFRLTFGALVVKLNNLFGATLRPGPSLPTYTAANIRKTSTLAGRPGRGSMRVGPLVEADTETNAPNTLVEARHTALTVGAAQFFIPHVLGAPRPGTIGPVVFARTTYLNQAAGPVLPTVQAHPILSTVVGPLITTQVSRKRRLGAS